MNLIEILPNIYGVKVPLGSGDFNKRNYDLYFDPMPLNLDIAYDILNIGFDFKIIGTITATEISFDASEVVEKYEQKIGWRADNDLSKLDSIILYRNYKLKKPTPVSMLCSTPEQSFRSALPKEIYFENTFGEEPIYSEYVPAYLNDNFNKRNKIEEFEIDFDTWQTAQQNITQKLLILQKL